MRNEDRLPAETNDCFDEAWPAFWFNKRLTIPLKPGREMEGHSTMAAIIPENMSFRALNGFTVAELFARDPRSVCPVELMHARLTTVYDFTTRRLNQLQSHLNSLPSAKSICIEGHSTRAPFGEMKPLRRSQTNKQTQQRRHPLRNAQPVAHCKIIITSCHFIGLELRLILSELSTGSSRSRSQIALDFDHCPKSSVGEWLS